MPCLEGFPCFSIFFPRFEEVTCTITRICRLIFIVELDMYIYLINQARGPYWENIGPRSWQYGPSAARSVQKRPRVDILPGRSQASLVNKRFITRLKLFRRKTQMIELQRHQKLQARNFCLWANWTFTHVWRFQKKEKQSWKKTKITFMWSKYS